MRHPFCDRTLALAAIFQAADGVNQLAREGRVNDAQLLPLVGSIFETDPKDTESVYGGITGVRRGLELLEPELRGRGDRDRIRYVIAMVHLERRLRRSNEVLQQIGEGVEAARRQLAYFSLSHETLFASLAQLYEETLSRLPPRIMVHGDGQRLTDRLVVTKIRSLLLAGVRSAMLWRQVGGKRFDLLLHRSDYLREAQTLLDGLDSTAVATASPSPLAE